MPLQPLIVTLFDPRGRCNRKGLFIIAALMVALEIMLGFGMWVSGRTLDDPLVMGMKALLAWWAVSAATQRLHDLGRAAWWMLGAALGLLVWGFVVALAVMSQYPAEDMDPGRTGYLIVLGSIATPLLTMLLWLHFARGEATTNRYGAVPSGFGFSRRPAPTAPDAPAIAASSAA